MNNEIPFCNCKKPKSYIKNQRTGEMYWCCDCDCCTITAGSFHDLECHRMNTNTEAATTADAQGVNVQMLHLVKRLLMNAPAVCWQPNLEEANELIAAIRADERAKVEREWQLRVQKLHRRAQAAESNVNKLECFRDGLGKTAAEQIRQLHKHSQALWRACERGGAEIVALRALWEKMRPFLNGVAETDTDDEHYLQHGYWHQRTLKTHEIKAAREVLATMDAARGGGDKCV